MDYVIQKERVELFAPNLNIEVVAVIEGNVQEKQLHDAIMLAVESQEVLQCKIKLDDKGKAFYTKADLVDPPIETYQEEWVTVVAKQEKIPFDLENGQMIRFFAKYQENGVEVLVIAHHLVGDGLTITYLLEDIVNALNGQQLNYKKIAQYDINSMPKNSRLNPLLRIMMKRTNKNWNKTGKVFSFQEYQSMFQTYWESHKTNILCDMLEEDTVDRIKKLAVQHKITINSLLTAAFLMAQKEIKDVGITVRLAPKSDTVRGNFSSAVSFHYAWNDTMDFWKNAKAIHRNIYKKLNSDKDKFFLTQFIMSLEPTLVDATYFAAYDNYTNKVAVSASDMFGYRKNDKKNISISNLTSLDFNLSEGDFLLRDITFVPPIASNAACMLGIVTFRGRMMITCHTDYSKEQQEQNDIFKKAMMNIKNL